MTMQHPAEFYLPCNDLWVITTYYNPAGYRIKRRHYDRFAAPLRKAGIPLITVECAFGMEPFELDPAPHIIRVRARDVLWLKERLINLAVAQLPKSAEKIAWLDGDILMSNPAWAIQTAEQLDRWVVVQPCDSVGRMNRDQNTYNGVGRRSFAYQLHTRPESACLGGAAHGQPGIAWAARRSLIEKHGLYDAAILDGGDELFSHALGGGFESPCVRSITGARCIEWPRLINRILNQLLYLPWPGSLAKKYVRRAVVRRPRSVPSESFYAHYLCWAQKLFSDVQGQIGYVPGMALHLWHGDPVNRQYSARNATLKRHCFDPTKDLRLTPDGAWEWASDKPLLHREVRDYFYTRREDE